MEHNTDRILWTVLILAIGVALFVIFKPATNGLLGQTTEKIQTVVNGVHGDTNTNLAHRTNSDWQAASFQNDWCITYLCNPIYEIVDDETYTTQVEVRNAAAPVMLDLFAFDANGDRDFNAVDANGYHKDVLTPKQATDKDEKISITFTAHLPEGYAYLRPDLAFTHPLTNLGSYKFRRFKIEKGVVTTP